MKLALSGLSVKANQCLLAINPATMQELFPLPTWTLNR